MSQKIGLIFCTIVLRVKLHENCQNNLFQGLKWCIAYQMIYTSIGDRGKSDFFVFYDFMWQICTFYENMEVENFWSICDFI